MCQSQHVNRVVASLTGTYALWCWQPLCVEFGPHVLLMLVVSWRVEWGASTGFDTRIRDACPSPKIQHRIMHVCVLFLWVRTRAHGAKLVLEISSWYPQLTVALPFQDGCSRPKKRPPANFKAAALWPMSSESTRSVMCFFASARVCDVGRCTLPLHNNTSLNSVY